MYCMPSLLTSNFLALSILSLRYCKFCRRVHFSLWRGKWKRWTGVFITRFAGIHGSFLYVSLINIVNHYIQFFVCFYQKLHEDCCEMGKTKSHLLSVSHRKLFLFAVQPVRPFFWDEQESIRTKTLLFWQFVSLLIKFARTY